MEMKVYQRPEFYVEEFVANEYVAACAWQVGTELTIHCGDVAQRVKISGESGGNYNLEGGGTMWKNLAFQSSGERDAVEYGAQMAMYAPHPQTESYINGNGNSAIVSVTSGEYYSHKATAANGTEVGSRASNGYTVCGCNFSNDSANDNPHHHVTNIINHSFS